MYRAATYASKGPAKDVLRIASLERTPLGFEDVRVRIHASGVNPSDVKSRSGAFGAAMPYPFVVPHSDGAGIIEAVGNDESAARVGERVWIYNGQWERQLGTAAEEIVLPATQAVPLPAAVDFASGACLGIPALTAYRAVHIDGQLSGKTVLVQGGAGAVAFYAIQFAKAAGARVLATISSAEKAAVALRAGADECIDYRNDDLAKRIADLTNGRGVERVIEVDVAANAATYPAIVAVGGTVVYYGSGTLDATIPATQLLRRDFTLRTFLVYQLPATARREAIVAITAMLEAGTLLHHIAQTYPLDAIADAHELVERGISSGGNVIVTPTI